MCVGVKPTLTLSLVLDMKKGSLREHTMGNIAILVVCVGLNV